MNSKKSPIRADASRLDLIVEFVSACTRISEYDELLHILAESAFGIVEFERLVILLCDDNRQILRTIVIENRSSHEMCGDEIQLSEMDLILQVLISGTESNRNTALCIPMESAGRMVGVLSLTSRNETHIVPEARFIHFLADCLAGAFDRLGKGVTTNSTSIVNSTAGSSTTSLAATHTVSLRMSYLAQHDALTDLPNRLLLDDRLARALTLSKRYGRRLAVMFLDLDRLKSINDSMGHMVGDQLLRQISDRLVKCVRSSDTVARIGGDEFVILLAELGQTEDARVSAEKIIAAIAAPMLVGDQEMRITLSIGVSIYPDDGDDEATLIHKADTAMYQAKASGFGKCMFFGKNECPADRKEFKSKRMR